MTLSGALTATYVLVSGNFYTLGMNPAELEVGASGIALSGKTNNFTIRNGSRVTLLASVSPALKVRGSYNSLLIDNSTVSNVNDAVILIGFTGGTRGNSLIVTNNGRLYGVAQIGASVSDSNETAVVVGGAGVTSFWDMASVANNFNVGNGNNDGNNTLWIDGAGFPGSAIVTNINRGFYLGGNPKARGDQIIVTNGGRLYSSVTLSFVNNGTTDGCTGNSFVVTGTGSLWEAGAAGVSAGKAGTTNNLIQILNGGVATNLGAITIDGVSNGLVIATGGKLFSKATTIGNAAGATLNYASITGENSLWNLGGQNLTVGAAGRTGNSLLIDQAGTVDNVATLTVTTNNSLALNGGTLGVTTLTYTNGVLFGVGSGEQGATLKSLAGGILTFSKGLLINSNATLTGSGTISGSGDGISLTNGANLSPGLAGVGNLTIGGSNLTWNAGATYLCEVTNFASAAGMGYDTINVSSQLALVADVGSSSLVIRLSSRGLAAANFSPNASYNLLVASCGSLTGYDPTQFTVNTNDFLNPPAGVWGVMGLDNNLYVTYRPTVDSGLAYTWAAPSNGNWTVDGNWVGGVSPSANSPGMQLTFGGGTSDPAYYATNNNSGQFQLNRLILTNGNAVATNYLVGNPLEFWNAGARIEQGGAGPFVVSNNLNLKLDLILGGNGAGTLTLASNITGVGTLTKQGASTVALNASNSFSGLVTVDGPGGILRIGHTNAFGTNSFVVNNGMLWITNNFTVGYGFYRAARVSGSGSIWSNSLALTLGPNGLIAVEGGGRLACGALTLANEGGANSGFGVTNGGQLYTTGAAQIGNARSNSTLTVGGGGSIWNAGSQALTVGTGTATGNVLRIDGQAVAGGAVVTNTSTLDVGKNSGANGNELQVVAGGRLFTSGATVVGTSSTGNTVRVEGAGSLWNASATAITIGSGAGAQSNRLVIDGNGISGGAVVSNINAFKVGNQANANATVITNGGFLQVGAGDLAIGSAGFSNTLVVVGGAGAVSMIDAGSQIIRIGYANGSNNTVLVDGRGVEGRAVITNGGVLVFGDVSLTPALQNRLIVTNGGVLYIGGARIGSAANSLANSYPAHENQLIVAEGVG